MNHKVELDRRDSVNILEEYTDILALAFDIHCPVKFMMATTNSLLRVGYVPEHFSTPLYFAQRHFALGARLIPFPSGTGHMITALRDGEIDVGIGLTEGWVAGLGKPDLEGDGGYKIVGTYVETPLCVLLMTPLS